MESFELASRRGPHVAREAVLEDKESDSDQPGQTAMHHLMELVRRTQKDPKQEHRGTGRQNTQLRKDTSVLEMWQEWSHATRLSSSDPSRPVCSSRDVPVGKRAIVKLTGQSLTGCNEAPKVVFKTGSIYSTCDSLIVTGSLNGRGCDITNDTGSNISIVRADVLTNTERQCIQPVRSCL